MTASSSVVLSNLAYLIGAIVLAVIFGLLVWLRHRKPKSIDANVESFNRGLRALAPDNPPRRRGQPAVRGALPPRPPEPLRSVRPTAARDPNPSTPPTAAAEAAGEPAGVEPG